MEVIIPMASPSLLVRLNTKKIDIDGYKYKTKNGYLIRK
jgi:hypothetical protein